MRPEALLLSLIVFAAEGEGRFALLHEPAGCRRAASRIEPPTEPQHSIAATECPAMVAQHDEAGGNHACRRDDLLDQLAAAEFPMRRKVAPAQEGQSFLRHYLSGLSFFSGGAGEACGLGESLARRRRRPRQAGALRSSGRPAPPSRALTLSRRGPAKPRRVRVASRSEWAHINHQGFEASSAERRLSASRIEQMAKAQTASAGIRVGG